MNKFPVLSSTLEGIFGAKVGLDESSAKKALASDLTHPPFRKAIFRETTEALCNEHFSWMQLLNECDVGYFESEGEARAFLQEVFWPAINEARKLTPPD